MLFPSQWIHPWFHQCSLQLTMLLAFFFPFLGAFPDTISTKNLFSTKSLFWNMNLINSKTAPLPAYVKLVRTFSPMDFCEKELSGHVWPSKALPESKHYKEILCTLYESVLENIYYHISFMEKLTDCQDLLECDRNAQTCE